MSSETFSPTNSCEQLAQETEKLDVLCVDESREALSKTEGQIGPGMPAAAHNPGGLYNSCPTGPL